MIRHPQPLVDADVCYGSSNVDVVADSLANITEHLIEILPQGLPVYTSPLLRCMVLAKQLAARLNCAAPSADVRLQELHFGAWEMQRWGDIPYAEVDAWAADIPNYCPGGGESLVQMAQRVLDFRADVMDRGQDSIVVCHAGSMRLLLASQHRTDAVGVAQWAAEQPLHPAWGELQRLMLGT